MSKRTVIVAGVGSSQPRKQRCARTHALDVRLWVQTW
jgi:hypothetical protein